jgi:hypothetical protein
VHFKEVKFIKIKARLTPVKTGKKAFFKVWEGKEQGEDKKIVRVDSRIKYPAYKSFDEFIDIKRLRPLDGNITVPHQAKHQSRKSRLLCSDACAPGVFRKVLRFYE